MSAEQAGTPGPGPLDEQLGYLLGQGHQIHRELAARRLAKLDLGPKDFGALAVLATEGPLSQHQLARRMGIDRTTMVAVVDALERHAFLARERDARDRRAYALRIAPRGRRVLDRATTSAREAEDEFLAPLSADQRQLLKATLRTLIRANRPPDSLPRPSGSDDQG